MNICLFIHICVVYLCRAAAESFYITYRASLSQRDISRRYRTSSRQSRVLRAVMLFARRRASRNIAARARHAAHARPLPTGRLARQRPGANPDNAPPAVGCAGECSRATPIPAKLSGWLTTGCSTVRRRAWAKAHRPAGVCRRGGGPRQLLTLSGFWRRLKPQNRSGKKYQQPGRLEIALLHLRRVAD